MSEEALLVVDVQHEYTDGALPIQFPPLSDSLERIGTAMDVSARRGVPIAVIQHTSTDPESDVFVRDSPTWQLHDVVAMRSYEVLIEKHLPGTFTGTALQEWLEHHGSRRLVSVAS